MRALVRQIVAAIGDGQDPEPWLRRAGCEAAGDLARELPPLMKRCGAHFSTRVLDVLLDSADPLAAVRAVDRYLEVAGGIDEEQLLWAIPLCARSAEAARFLLREPESLSSLVASPYLARPQRYEALRAELSELPEDDAEAMARLRRFRRYHHARIAWRDVTGRAPQSELLCELADLAEAILDAATVRALAAVERRYGPPLTRAGAPCRFCVLGCGKLGGRELNFSSDVDVLYVYQTDEGDSAAELTLHEFFNRVARRINQLVGEPTEDGFALRVDLDLRPEGTKGPLVNSLPSMESYYESWGQTWERGALIKARPVGGDRAFGSDVLDALRPFVYRRTLDHAAFAEIRSMKTRIDSSVRQRGGTWNVKLGRGGIREIEFFVQAHQLLLGGKRPELQVKGTLAALEALAESGVIATGEAEELRHAYLFLRRLEHHLQIPEGRQTHSLPEGDDELAVLAIGLGLARETVDRSPRRAVALLEREIRHHRRVVITAFDGLLHGGPAEESGLPAALRGLASAEPGGADAAALQALRGYGLRDPEAAYRLLARLAAAPGSPLHPRSSARVRPLAVQLLQSLSASPDPDQALLHAADLLYNLRGRLGAYALLQEHPATLKTLLALFGTSDFLAKLVVRRPELLDPLIIGAAAPRRTRDELVRDLQNRTEDAHDEVRLDEWRSLQSEELLRIGLLDVAGTLELLEVQQELTSLAEALLDEALRWAIASVQERFGYPTGEEGPVPLCVVGMGKLGGRELNYNSDLDLLFLYGGSGECPGEDGLTSREFFAKVAQRLLFGLSCVTAEGSLYQIDSRLRPSGRHGSLVSSLRAFAKYHDESAHVWERLALTKARPVAGDPALLSRVETLLAGATYGRPWPEGGAVEIARIRKRMEVEIARERRTFYNVKTGRGGLVDIEFAAQLLCLTRGGLATHRTSTLDALASLDSAGAWDSGDLRLLREAYLWLRRLENRIRIHHDNAQSVLVREPEAVQLLARRMGFEGGGEALLTAYAETVEGVREVFERVIEALP